MHKKRMTSTTRRNGDQNAATAASSNDNAAATTMVKHEEWEKAVTKQEFDQARYRHDVFNLLAMIPVMVFTILDFELWIFTREFNLEWQPSRWFWFLWWSSALYTSIDLVWLVSVPHCVRTPKTIIEHHYMSLLYLVAPLPFVYMRPFMGPIISVEINSFLSFARRVAWKSKHWSGDIFHVLFLVSWIITRVLIYPALLVVFWRIIYVWVHPPFSWIHLPIFFVPVHCYFVYMNLVWTRQLFTPLLKQWWGQFRRLIGSSTTAKTDKEE